MNCHHGDNIDVSTKAVGSEEDHRPGHLEEGHAAGVDSYNKVKRERERMKSKILKSWTVQLHNDRVQ